MGLTYFCSKAAAVIAVSNAPPEQWARLTMFYLGGGFILVSLVHIAASVIETSIDGYPELSYLRLNKGDVKLIDEFSARRKRVVLRFLGGCLLTVVLGIAATRLERLL